MTDMTVMAMGQRKARLEFGGIAHAVITVPTEDAHKAIIKGTFKNPDGRTDAGFERYDAKGRSLHVIYVCSEPTCRKMHEGPAIPLTCSACGRGPVEDGVTRHAFDIVPVPEGRSVLVAHLHNAFVNQGLQGALDSMYGDLTASRITHIGLSADDQAVTAATTSLDPAGGATGTSIKTTTSTSRTNQTVSTQQTWTQADVAFAIKKIGLLRGSAATTVSNIIGGTGGVAPYNEPFTIDLTTIATWSLTMGVDCTATAS